MLLILSIAFLFIAPLITSLTQSKDYLTSSLNGFVFVAIAALIFLDIVPALINQTGFEIILILLLGLAFPYLTEKVIHNSRLVHKAIVIIAIFGLVIHTLMDGIALSTEHSTEHLALAVALHRIPVGLVVWWYIRPNYGNLVAYLMLGIIASGTLVGYYFSGQVFETLQATEIAYFQALVAGMLIHVVLHTHHDEVEDASRVSLNRKAEGIGNLLGILSIYYLLGDHHHHTDVSIMNEVYSFITLLLFNSAPVIISLVVIAAIVNAILTNKQDNNVVKRPIKHALMNGLVYATHDLFDRLAPVVLMSIVALSVFAYLFNWLELMTLDSTTYYWAKWSALITVIILLIYSIYRNGLRAFISRVIPITFDSKRSE